MKQAIKIEMRGSYKLGMDEVVGLKEAIIKAFKPVQDALKDKVYWNECVMEDVEYRSRDGFIAYKHNCGGIEIDLVIPFCERYEFDHILEFGECDDCVNDEQCGYKGMECAAENDGLLDARFRIWFKFEGINDQGEMKFYLTAHGGNGDAPYFRPAHLDDVFEASFTTKTVAGVQRAASKHIKALVALIRGGAQ